MDPAILTRRTPGRRFLGRFCAVRTSAGITGTWGDMEAVLEIRVRHGRWRRARLSGWSAVGRGGRGWWG